MELIEYWLICELIASFIAWIIIIVLIISAFFDKKHKNN